MLWLGWWAVRLGFLLLRLGAATSAGGGDGASASVGGAAWRPASSRRLQEDSCDSVGGVWEQAATDDSEAFRVTFFWSEARGLEATRVYGYWQRDVPTSTSPSSVPDLNGYVNEDCDVMLDLHTTTTPVRYKMRWAGGGLEMKEIRPNAPVSDVLQTYSFEPVNTYLDYDVPADVRGVCPDLKGQRVLQSAMRGGRFTEFTDAEDNSQVRAQISFVNHSIIFGRIIPLGLNFSGVIKDDCSGSLMVYGNGTSNHSTDSFNRSWYLGEWPNWLTSDGNWFWSSTQGDTLSWAAVAPVLERTAEGREEDYVLAIEGINCTDMMIFGRQSVVRQQIKEAINRTVTEANYTEYSIAVNFQSCAREDDYDEAVDGEDDAEGQTEEELDQEGEEGEGEEEEEDSSETNRHITYAEVFILSEDDVRHLVLTELEEKEDDVLDLTATLLETTPSLRQVRTWGAAPINVTVVWVHDGDDNHDDEDHDDGDDNHDDEVQVHDGDDNHDDEDHDDEDQDDLQFTTTTTTTMQEFWVLEVSGLTCESVFEEGLDDNVREVFMSSLQKIQAASWSVEILPCEAEEHAASMPLVNAVYEEDAGSSTDNDTSTRSQDPDEAVSEEHAGSSTDTDTSTGSPDPDEADRRRLQSGSADVLRAKVTLPEDPDRMEAMENSAVLMTALQADIGFSLSVMEGIRKVSEVGAQIGVVISLDGDPDSTVGNGSPSFEVFPPSPTFDLCRFTTCEAKKRHGAVAKVAFWVILAAVNLLILKVVWARLCAKAMRSQGRGDEVADDGHQAAGRSAANPHANPNAAFDMEAVLSKNIAEMNDEEMASAWSWWWDDMNPEKVQAGMVLKDAAAASNPHEVLARITERSVEDKTGEEPAAGAGSLKAVDEESDGVIVNPSEEFEVRAV